jgi:NNMT/PNMT/TEMT family
MNMNNLSGCDYTQFNPRDYLQEYYSHVSPENFALLQFAVKAFQIIPAAGVLLDFGGGPTLYPLIAAAKQGRDIHFCDYLDANLAQVQQWLQADSEAFNWQEFVEVTLKLENQTDEVSAEAVNEREAALRAQVSQVFKCDMNYLPPIANPIEYDVVISNFCAESATDNRAQWRMFFHNTVSLVKPDGFLLLSALKGATCYAVGERFFSAVSLTEEDLKQALEEEGFEVPSLLLETVPADPTSHYAGLIMILARKLGEKF